jgi:hypothetical protein
MSVRISFDYEPDEPEDDPTGMSEAEHMRVMDALAELGAMNITIAAKA